MQEDVVLTLLQGDSRINEVLDKLESEGFKWNGGESVHNGYIQFKQRDINLYINYKTKKLLYGSINYIDSNFKDITIDEFLGISNLTFNSIITSTSPLYIEFKDKNKFKRFIMECYMREDDVFSNTLWGTTLNQLELQLTTFNHLEVFINPKINYLTICRSIDSKDIINGDDITYPSVSKETINSIISPIIKDGEVVRNYKEIVDVIAKLKEL